MKFGYTTILHEPRLKLDISCNEYCLADMIYRLSTNPSAPIKGWCSASQSMLGLALGVSRQSVSTLVKKLSKKNIVVKSDNGKLLKSGNAWIDIVVAFDFSSSKESLQGVKKVYSKECKESLHNVKKVDIEVSRKFTVDSKESLHNNNKDNNTNNNIPPKVGKIETKIPEDWKIEIKQAVIQFLEYRQALPTKDRIKTQQGWNGKINLFSKIIKDHSGDILVKSINLSIEKEYKNVNPEWLFNLNPKLRKSNNTTSTLFNPTTLNENKSHLFFRTFATIYTHKREKELTKNFNHTVYESGKIIDKEIVEIERPAAINNAYKELLLNVEKKYPEMFKKTNVAYQSKYIK